MNKFIVTKKQFLNQYRNGDNFTLNTTEFTTRLQGNVGEKVRLIESIEVATIANESKAVEVQFLETEKVLRGPLLDWKLEGFYMGATLLIETNGATATATCEGYTGNGNIDLRLDSTGVTNMLATGVEDGECRDDIVVKVTNAPEYLLYKYGINPNDLTAPNYLSPIDGAEQSYQLNGITGVAASMRFTGKEQGSSLGEITVQFDSTVDGYRHNYTIVHDFVLPYYTEGQLNNVQNEQNPTEYQRNSSVKYGNGFFFGGLTNETVMTFEDLGEIGNVGYFGDNFNGFEGQFGIEDYDVSNPSKTGKLEATETNRVTFSITTTGPAFVGGEEIILYHTKFPSTTDSANQREAFDDIWLKDQVRQTEGAAAAASLKYFSNVLVILNAGKLDVSADVSYPPDDQEKIDNTALLGLYFNIATTNLSDPDNNNRGSVIAAAGQASKDEEVSGLITGWQPGIYKNAEFDTGVTYTNFDGWNGDLNGQSFTFDTDVTQGAIVTKAIFRIVADDGTDFFQLGAYVFPINKIATVDVGGNTYQATNINIQGPINLPSGLLITDVKFTGVIPGAVQPTQNFVGSIGFRVPHKEWIENLAVPSSFIDYTEPNDNRNFRSSNYSGVSGYEIKTILSVVVENTTGPNTEYDLLSDGSDILDFDDNGGNPGAFAGTTNYYDSNGDATSNLFTNDDVRVEIEFAHTLGVLALGNLTGRIWMETENSTGEPVGELSTDLDFTSAANTLIPTDTLTTGNTTLVEVVSVNNLVTLICEVNRNNITDGQTYNIYGRLDSI